MDNANIYFSRIANLVKYENVEGPQEMVDRVASIKSYLDSLNIDKRRIAVGFDILMWYFDIFSSETSEWNNNFGTTYGGAPAEQAFLFSKPAKSLLSYPAWNTGLAKLMNEKSELTLINSHQLDLFEQFCKKESETWNYDTISRQDAEQGDGGPFDFIAINSYDIFHDPELVKSYFNMLSTGGVLVIGHINENNSLYEAEMEYTSGYAVHAALKSFENARVYHDYTVMGTTFAIKM